MVGGHSGERLSQAGLGLAGFGGPHHQSHLPVGLAFRRAGLKEVGAVVDLVHSAYRGDSSRQGWTTEAHLLEGQRTDVAAVREVIEQLGSKEKFWFYGVQIN